MKIRSDSPFAKLTAEDRQWILEYAESHTIERVTDNLVRNYDVDTSDSAVHRFVARLRTEKAVQDATDKHNDLEELGELGKKSSSREVARQKLVDVAANAEADESEKLME